MSQFLIAAISFVILCKELNVEQTAQINLLFYYFLWVNLYANEQKYK